MHPACQYSSIFLRTICTNSIFPQASTMCLPKVCNKTPHSTPAPIPVFSNPFQQRLHPPPNPGIHPIYILYSIARQTWNPPNWNTYPSSPGIFMGEKHARLSYSLSSTLQVARFQIKTHWTHRKKSLRPQLVLLSLRLSIGAIILTNFEKFSEKILSCS